MRKALPRESLLTVPGGYQLAIAERDTDLGRLREALSRSREPAGREPAEAAALLDGAMR